MFISETGWCAVFFDKARARAKALDDEFARTGKVSGPLHGVPVSPTFSMSCRSRTLTTSNRSALRTSVCTGSNGYNHCTSTYTVTVEIEGVDLTIGFTQWANNPSTINADVGALSPSPPRSTAIMLLPLFYSSSLTFSLPARYSSSKQMFPKQCSRSNARTHFGAVRLTHTARTTHLVALLAERGRC